MEENWIYVGIFLDDTSKKKLKKLYNIPEGWKEYFDHMTVIYNDESGYDWNEVDVGMMFMEPFFWGWKCAKKLNLKYNSRDKVKLPLNRFAK